MHTLFISDLHLTPSRPDLTKAFITFLKNEAYNADALYILGDLFDFWIGDDDTSDFANKIKNQLKELTSSGIPCYFLHGNRDFLLGKSFAKQTGMVLLSEETVIQLYEHSILLMHGDTLCTDDKKYLAFRAKVHQPWLQIIYKFLPFKLKCKIVANIKGSAKQDKHQKALDIMDVTPSAVEDVMQKHHVHYLIHGHTHRPNTHHLISGHERKSRIVLGDWDHELYALKIDNTFNIDILRYAITNK